MDVARINLPALKLPLPNIVTEPPPMSPLLSRTSVDSDNLADNKNKMMRRTGSTAHLSTGLPRSGFLSPSCPSSPSGSPRSTLLSPSCPSSPSGSPKKTLTSPSSNTLQINPPTLRRAISDPSGMKNSGKSKRRVSLGPGCGMLDWIRLCKNTKDMAGTGGEELIVTEEELAKHCTIDDAWTSIRGKVYNITPYFKFHPGGKDDLLKAAGKDCTILFDEVHKWVNYANMLKKCFVGKMAEEQKRGRSDSSLSIPKQLIVTDGMNRQAVSKRSSESSDEAMVHSPQSPVHPPIQFIEETDSPAILVDPPSPIRKNSDASRPVVTLWDWNQTDETVNIQVFIHNQNIVESDIIVDASERSFEASIKLDSWIYEMEISLHKPVKNPKVFIHCNKVDIRLTKTQPNETWDSIGTLLPTHNQMVSESNRVMKFRSCTIRSVEEVTHDTKLFTLDIPASCCMSVPVGHHVSIKPNEPGNDLERSYTPVEPLSSSATSTTATSSRSANSNADSNTIELLIKLYKDGAMSHYLAKLSPGDQLRVSDPQGTFDSSRLNNATDVLLIAAGSGFTPMVRVLNHLLACKGTSKDCATEPARKNIHLLFANKTTKDIIWEDDMKRLVAKNEENFKVTHILSSPDDSWKGLKGRVTSELVKSNLPSVPSTSSDDQEETRALVCVCGPLPFTETISDTLLDIDYPEQCIHVFQ